MLFAPRDRLRLSGRHAGWLLSLATPLLLAACVQVPPGPAIRVVPGPGKSAAQFQNDDLTCRGTAGSRAMNRATATGPVDQYTVQRVYDDIYAQCMANYGNVVPGYATSTPIPSGPDPALVRAVQTELQRLSFLDSSPDGAYGPMTRTAIQAFERANGMPVTGAVTQRILARLRSGTASAAAPAGEPSAATGPGASSWVAPITQPGSAPGGMPNNGSAKTGAANPGSGPAPASGWVTPVKPP